MVDETLGVECDKVAGIQPIFGVDVDFGRAVFVHYFKRHASSLDALGVDFFERHQLAWQRVRGMEAVGFEFERVSFVVFDVFVLATDHLHGQLHEHFETIEFGKFEIVVVSLIGHESLNELFEVLIVLLEKDFLVLRCESLVGIAFNDGHVDAILALHGQAQAVGCFFSA